MTAPATVDRQLLVATCIGCGARSRPGACEDECDDVPLRARVAALRAIAESLASDGSPGWDRLREQAREALLVPLPAAVEEPAIVEAWGCPRCGASTRRSRASASASAGRWR